MSTLFDRLQPTLEPEVFAPLTAEPEITFGRNHEAWDPILFGEQQIQSLVSQIFLARRPKPARQIVFTAVDGETDIATICMQVGQVLCDQVSGSVCVVQSSSPPHLDNALGMARRKMAFGEDKFGSLRNSSRRVSDNLWLLPGDIFAEGRGSGFSTEPLSGRVAELRLDFDYSVLCGPPAGKCSQAALLGHLCDGIVLVLEANSTRRVAAQRVKESFHAANARLLGTVLNQRTFPIPDGIYRKL